MLARDASAYTKGPDFQPSSSNCKTEIAMASWQWHYSKLGAQYKN